MVCQVENLVAIRDQARSDVATREPEGAGHGMSRH
jgi:hypothetical protein